LVEFSPPKRKKFPEESAQQPAPFRGGGKFEDVSTFSNPYDQLPPMVEPERNVQFRVLRSNFHKSARTKV
jgi:hypothetical protein